MSDYDADSSVLVKHHVRESGTDWFAAVADPATGNTILTAQVSQVEVISALQRRVREGVLEVKGIGAAVAHGHDLAAYGVVQLGRATDGLLPHALEVQGGDTAHALGQPLAVGVVDKESREGERYSRLAHIHSIS